MEGTGGPQRTIVGMGDMDMGDVSDDLWRTTRWVCTESLEPSVAQAVAADEPTRFHRAVIDVERALAQARVDGDFSPLHARYGGVMTFFSGRAQLEPDDLRRCAHVSLQALHACSGDVSAQARWGGMTTRILETYGSGLALSIDWRPLYAILAKYLAGGIDAYNGAIPTAVHIAVLSRLAQKARRHFSNSAPSEIWQTLKPKIKSLDCSACFEGVGMLHLLMPCSRVGEELGSEPDNESENNTNDWSQWFDEWVTMQSWMPTNRFWQTAWFAIFSQLAKHDVSGKLNWEKHAASLHTTSLWFMEVPVGGVEGSCPFGRRTSSRAAYLFSRSVNDSEQRAKFAAKILIHRLPSDDELAKSASDQSSDQSSETSVRAVEALFDVVENYAHPSNAGRWTNTLATFLTHSVKYMRKRIAAAEEATSEGGDQGEGTDKGLNLSVRPLPAKSVQKRFALAATRLIDKGMYSKVSSMRFASASSARHLAYIEPDSVLPLVMSRFAQAVDHGTATHQLTSALSVLTFTLRPMLVAPRDLFFSEAFADVGIFGGVGQFLEFVLHTTLPGIDANDPSKTLGVIRLYTAIVSNLTVLVDPFEFKGNEATDEVFPFNWSNWLDLLLGRFFTFFENADPGNVGKADGADKHRGGAGSDHGASYLMGGSSMYSPLVRLIFARAEPKTKTRLVKRVAQFVLQSTHSGLTMEVGQMVMAAATQTPEETYLHLTKPLLETLTAEVKDLVVLASEKTHVASSEIVSPTKEAKLRWQTGLLGAALHYGGRKVLDLSPGIREVLRTLFKLCASTNSICLGEMAAHVLSLLCGALSGTYIVDLFASDFDLQSLKGEVDEENSIPFPAKWSASKTVETPGLGSEMGGEKTPRAFTWRAPGADDLAAAREIATEFITAPCYLILKDGKAMPKAMVRAHLASIGGTASGFRLRMADFDPENNSPVDAETAKYPPYVLGVQDTTPCAVSIETRALAASAVAHVLANAASDDAETLGMALAVAEDILNPSTRDYRGCKAALRTWRADASALTKPKGSFACDPTGDSSFLKERPRWLVGEYTFLRFLWRSSQSNYHNGGPGCVPSKHPDHEKLLSEVRRLSMHKYVSVRHHARVLVEQQAKRFPNATASLVSPARDALEQTPGDEDRCVAACALLKMTPSVNRMRADASHFRATTAALLNSSHHDAEKAQTAINEVFLSIAIRFSRNSVAVDLSQESKYLQTRKLDLDATRDLLFQLMAPPSVEKVCVSGVPAVGASLHWSYALMANALLLFLTHPESVANDKTQIEKLTAYLMACVLGPTKTLRLPSVCALLMLARYDGFEEFGVDTLRELLSQPNSIDKLVTNLGLCHHIGNEASQGRQTSRADALSQAAESLYGAGADMAGTPWPNEKGGAVDQNWSSGESGTHFITACARVWKLFASVAPETMNSQLEASLKLAASVQGDRGQRVAAAEALAGVLACGDVETKWASSLLLKTVAECSADESEEWLRAVRYACRGETVGEGCDALLDGVLAASETSSSSTTAREARRLETALACVAQLTCGDAKSVTSTGLRFQETVLAELLDPTETPLGRDSRQVRVEAAKVCAALVGAHLAPDGARYALDDDSLDESKRKQLQKCRDLCTALLESFTASAEEASRLVVLQNPAAMDVDVTNSDGDTSSTSDKKKGQWLEGVFLTLIQLAKHGDVAGDLVATAAARLLPSVLRAQETPDRDFALVAKRTITYLKYIVFLNKDVLCVAVQGVLDGLKDANWHTRLATLKFAQAFVFRHAFVLPDELQLNIRTAVLSTLNDPQIEVRLMGSDTLVGFLRGTHVYTGASDALRELLVSQAKGAFGSMRGTGGKTSTEDSHGTGISSVQQHGAVLGLASVVLSTPYDTPRWMPAVLEHLARWTSSASPPIKESTRRAFGEFKKTHLDVWAETKARFTADQWENVAAGMELAPSYIS